MDRDPHQFEISVGAFTLPAVKGAYDLREGEEVDRSAVMRLLCAPTGSAGDGTLPSLPALPPWSRLRVAEVRHLFWDDVDQLLHTVSVRLEPASEEPAIGTDPVESDPLGPNLHGRDKAKRSTEPQSSAPAPVGSSHAST